MIKLLPVLFCFLSYTAFAQQTLTKFRIPEGVREEHYLSDRIIVKFKKSVPEIRKNAVLSVFDNLERRVNNKELELKQLFKNNLNATTQLPISDYDTIGVDRIYEIKLPVETNIETAINKLLQNPDLEYAEPSYVYRTNYIPNDPFYSGSQNYLNQMKANLAWDIIRNSGSSIIGIVDSGTDLDHPDLRPNLILPGKDLVGASFTTMIEDNDPDVKSDSADHGVRVSGVASAVSDNGIGVASVAFNARLLIVKAGADNDASSIYRGYEGIKYAADNGAHIINCSWGGPAGGAYGQDIVNYALSKGALIIAAAGNDDTSIPEYPALYEGVMAVGSVDASDRKSNFSNYGVHVDIVAPGDVFTTANGGNYIVGRGTSFSVPLVASAAALVRARFPQFAMEQVREQIRITADNVDAENPAFIGRLGRGRLNVFRAVTETPPSIRYQALSISDKGNGSIPAGDTIRIRLDIKNFLSAASGLTLRLSSDNADVEVIDSDISVGNIGMMETKSGLGPLRVYIKPGVNANEEVIFKLSYAATGGYSDSENFTVTVALDYLNVEVNQISTTFTSNGRIGYDAPESRNGLGFIYKNEQLLYEASLMIGNAPTRVSNNARNSDNNYDEHFQKRITALRVSPSEAAFKGISEFDDSASPNPIDIYVKHSQTAFSDAPHDRYTIAEYEIKNTSAEVIKSLYVGLFTDWDVDLTGRDFTRYDPVNKLGYVAGRFGGTSFAGVKLLNQTALPAYYPLSYQVPGNILATGSFFSIAEKYETLSSGIVSSGLGENSTNGLDVSFVMGYGPFTIPVNASVKVAFAILAGDDLQDLQTSSQAAQQQFLLMQSTEPQLPLEGFALRQNYPNPARTITKLDFSIAESGLVNLNLYDALGKKVRDLVNDTLPPGSYSINIPLSDLESGVYLYKMQFNGKEKSLKMIVIH